MSRDLFPIPNSGRVRIEPSGGDTFDVECSGMNSADNERLEGFFNRMYGRLMEFRFEHAGVIHPKCRFDSDSITFTANGPDNHSATLPIKVLRERTRSLLSSLSS
jgi:hypothetical protein